MSPRAGALALWLAVSPTLPFAETCVLLRDLAASAEDGFTGRARPDDLPGAQSCNVTRDTGGLHGYLCYWQFAYRDAAASRAFDALNRDIARCLPDAAEMPDDTAVNHPDSYHLRRYRLAVTVLSVSLKDKAAEGRSLVFLRLDPD